MNTNSNSSIFFRKMKGSLFVSSFSLSLVWICVTASIIELELLAMAKIAFVCALHLMLERYFGTVDSGSKSDLSTDQYSIEAREKVHICSTAGKICTASWPQSTAL
jgi:hypothetical protein